MSQFIILFCICFSLHVLRTIYSIFKYKKQINSKNKFIFLTMLIIMILLWVSFFQMSENDTVKLLIPEFVKYFGFILFILGLILFIVPLIQLKGLENIDHLVTNGIFSIIRHPMYLGMIFWILGYPLFMQAKYTLITSIIWIPNILYWRFLEEKELLNTFNEYKSYKKRTIF
ncbi:MAG: isoprenylcysteine carboxylmethyltransferase family protein [Melioribacteraceae bacterium]